MQSVWETSVTLSNGRKLSDISISASSQDGSTYFSTAASLRFLSVVETARIPIHMSIGRPCVVTSTSEETEAWFSSILLAVQDADEGSGRWWQGATTNSPLGILVAVDDPPNNIDTRSGPKVTELLFFASKNQSRDRQSLISPSPSSSLRVSADGLHIPRVEVYALPLSSELLSEVGREPTPPTSPLGNNEDIEAVFLPSSFAESVNEPPVKKRKTVNDTFDEAAERRRKARRKGGEGVAAAAANQSKSEETMPALKHRRSISNSQGLLQNRPLSRASSVTTTRPTSGRESSLSAPSKPSGLSHSQSAPIVPEPSGEALLEQKNKEFVSKMVMANMRIHGMSQSKSRRSKANSAAASPAVDIGFDQIDADRKNDEEYKLMYHQIYKGTCFMFRQFIATSALQVHIGAVEETVNRLLSIFLLDPLTIGETNTAEDGITPGGRKAFGSAVRDEEAANPFLKASVIERESKPNTPSVRRPDK